MKKIIITFLVLANCLCAGEIEGEYVTTFEKIEGVEWELPGLAPWEEKIKVKGNELTLMTLSEPITMKFEEIGDFILGKVKEGNETYYFPIYLSTDGSLHMQGKRFIKKPQPVALSNVTNAPWLMIDIRQ